MEICIRDMTLEEFSEYGEDCQSLICQGFVDEIPSHGRLIDANALARFLLDKYWDSSLISPSILDLFVSEIANAPTIISASQEGK